MFTVYEPGAHPYASPKKKAKKKRTRKAKPKAPSEEFEQHVLAAWLDSRRIDGWPLLWAHIPNGGHKSARMGARRKRMGARAGVPDVLIFDHPRGYAFQGAAIELKRKDGKPSDVSASQTDWLEKLGRRGWLCRVCYGADDAIRWLEGLGY